jgi:predicted Co/Zn/Cd cation transporter (cation efflux family)
MALAGWLSVRGHLQFSGLFHPIFAAIGLKLDVLLCSQELLFQFTFRIIDLFLQELCPWNLAEFQIFSVFRTFFIIFAGIGLKLGVLLCSQELLFQFAFRCN